SFFYDGEESRSGNERFAAVVTVARAAGRYAMKANYGRKILDAVRDAGLWIDAVSGNEALRARRAGFPGGSDPPVILLTTDVFRDNALDTVCREQIMPNLGSPSMIRE